MKKKNRKVAKNEKARVVKEATARAVENAEARAVKDAEARAVENVKGNMMKSVVGFLLGKFRGGKKKGNTMKNKEESALENEKVGVVKKARGLLLRNFWKVVGLVIVIFAIWVYSFFWGGHEETGSGGNSGKETTEVIQKDRVSEPQEKEKGVSPGGNVSFEEKGIKNSLCKSPSTSLSLNEQIVELNDIIRDLIKKYSDMDGKYKQAIAEKDATIRGLESELLVIDARIVKLDIEENLQRLNVESGRKFYGFIEKKLRVEKVDIVGLDNGALSVSVQTKYKNADGKFVLLRYITYSGERARTMEKWNVITPEYKDRYTKGGLKKIGNKTYREFRSGIILK